MYAQIINFGMLEHQPNHINQKVESILFKTSGLNVFGNRIL